MKFLSSCVLLTLAIAMLATTHVTTQNQGQAAGRQGGGRGQAYTNLRVLPRDIAPQQLGAIMQQFNAALGVDCAYCHNYAGRGNPMNDMAADDKAPKRTARVMMVAQNAINERFGTDLGKPKTEVTEVQCMTCHRGTTIPTVAASPTP